MDAHDTFDVVELGASDNETSRCIIISYDGNLHRICEEKVWSLLGRDYDKNTDYWFVDAGPVHGAFKDFRYPYMARAICTLMEVLHEGTYSPPVYGVSLRKIEEIAHKSGDFEGYFRSILSSATGPDDRR